MIVFVTFFTTTHPKKKTMVDVVIFFFSNIEKRGTRQWQL
jgi:hypothetical protein